MNKKLMILTLGLALAPMSVSAFFGSLATKAGYALPGVEGFVTRKVYNAFKAAQSSADSLIAAAQPGLEVVVPIAEQVVVKAPEVVAPIAEVIAEQVATNPLRFFLPGSSTGVTKEAYTLGMAQLEKAAAEKAILAAEVALRPMQAAGAATVAGVATATAGVDALVSKSVVAAAAPVVTLPVAEVASAAFFDVIEQTLNTTIPAQKVIASSYLSSAWNHVGAHKYKYLGGTLATAAVVAGCYYFDVNPIRGLAKGWNNLIDAKIQRRLAAQQQAVS